MFTEWEQYNRSIRVVVLARLDAIMYGVLVAALHRYWDYGFNLLRRLTPFTAIVFASLCVWWFVSAPGLMNSKFVQDYVLSFQAIICAMLLPWFVKYEPSAGQSSFILVTSKLSYSLYLTHILVIIATNIALTKLKLFEIVYNNPYILFPLYFCLFYFLAFLTYRLIEKPFIDLRESNFDKKSLVQAAAIPILACAVLIGFF